MKEQSMGEDEVFKGGKRMTDYGYDYILEQIHEMIINPCDYDHTLEEAKAYLNGYSDATVNIVNLIKDIKESHSQGR